MLDKTISFVPEAALDVIPQALLLVIADLVAARWGWIIFWNIVDIRFLQGRWCCYRACQDQQE